MISLFCFLNVSVNQLFDCFGSCTSFDFKTFHKTNSFYLAIPLRGQKEECWIRELGTPTTYGCNGKIERISIIACPCCRSVNMSNISYSTLWCSHGHRLLMTLSRLYEIRWVSVTFARSFYHFASLYLQLTLGNYFCKRISNHYKLTIILEIGSHTIFKPVKFGKYEKERIFK